MQLRTIRSTFVVVLVVVVATTTPAPALAQARRDDVEAAFEAQLDALVANEGLAAATDALRNQLQAGQDVSARRWYTLARYQEALQLWHPAVLSVGKARALDRVSIPFARAEARLLEREGSLARAAAAYRALLARDPGSRVEYLRNLTGVAAQLGHHEETLQIGREFLAADPQSAGSYSLFADLCFRLGETEAGFNTLRQGARQVSGPGSRLLLATALSRRGRTKESIREAADVYLEAFEASPTLDEKLAVVDRLAVVHRRAGRFDRLVEQLGRLGDTPKGRRDGALYLARAYHAIGDDKRAQEQLDPLLRDNAAAVPQLLLELVALAEARQDLRLAIGYQRKLVELSPVAASRIGLARLLIQAGEFEEASKMGGAIGTGVPEGVQLLTAVDSRLTSGRFEAAHRILDPALRAQPGSWKLLYRDGVALASLKQPTDAAARFESILSLQLPDDELSLLLRGKGSRPDTTDPGGRSADDLADYRLNDRVRLLEWVAERTGVDPGGPPPPDLADDVAPPAPPFDAGRSGPAVDLPRPPPGCKRAPRTRQPHATGPARAAGIPIADRFRPGAARGDWLAPGPGRG